MVAWTRSKQAHIQARVYLEGPVSRAPEVTSTWTWGETPAGSTATLARPGGPHTSFVPDVVGMYRVFYALHEPGQPPEEGIWMIEARRLGGWEDAPAAPSHPPQSPRPVPRRRH